MRNRSFQFIALVFSFETTLSGASVSASISSDSDNVYNGYNSVHQEDPAQTITGGNIISSQPFPSPSLFGSNECPNFCADMSNCNWNICRRCSTQCSGECTFDVDNQMNQVNLFCAKFCKPEKKAWQCGLKSCKLCKLCISQESSPPSCPLATFEDATQKWLPPSDNYWNSWGHSGKPYTYYDSPLFVDINNDGHLDFFNSLHGHGLDQEKGYTDRFELGIAVPSSYFSDGIAANNLDPEKYRYSKASHRIKNTETELKLMDAHGRNVLDLDNDGYLDILINSGSSKGGVKGDENSNRISMTRDNFLFWGEPGQDDITGERATIFKGGRNEARNANLHMRNGRGRVSYMMDVNGDGLIDIFIMQDRRVDNILAPGILLINNGNRTWSEDSSMREFTRSMILTDADGDGKAQEILITRGFCYPQRDGPHPHNQFGAYTAEVLDFCSSRPVGTTAVYKFDKAKNKMVEISPKYWNGSPYNHKQPPCCQNGAFSTSNNCHARSIGTGDFDGDLLTDHIFLYITKMVIYYSSDRPKGALPIGNDYVSSEIYFPSHCTFASSIRVLDIDNDGFDELLVFCELELSTFLIYKRDNIPNDSSSYGKWTLHNECNTPGALGDLVDPDLASFTEDDIIESCNGPVSNWVALKTVCDDYNESNYSINTARKKATRKTSGAGISTVDLNNDGFVDVVVSYSFGYTRYFTNSASNNNGFIIFILKGAGNENGNAYAIGASVVLRARNLKTETYQLVKKVKYVSSYQHTTDKYGYIDDRVKFGLGDNYLIPMSVTVHWPNGDRSITPLPNWNLNKRLDPIVLEQNKEIFDTNHESKIAASIS